MGACMDKPHHEKINVLVVGANGQLGSLIVKHCIEKPNLTVHILVRDFEKSKDIISLVQKHGGKALKGDITQPESLKGVTNGMHTVINAVAAADDKIAVDGQIALGKECIASGVKRYVPADFGVNYTKFNKEHLKEVPVIRQKVLFQDWLDNNPSLKTLHFWQGVFTEMYFYLQSQGFHYWGDVNQKIDLTSYEDTAKVVASAVSNENRFGDVIFIGEQISTAEIAKVYNQERSANIQPKSYGSLDDNNKKFHELLTTNFGYAIGTGIEGLVYDSRGSFTKSDSKEFPEVKATSFAEYLRTHPDKKLA